MKWSLILLCLLCWSRPSLNAQDYWTLEQYTVKEGLRGEVVSALAKDEQGFLWVGTGEGLYRFDGQRFSDFHIYPVEAAQRLPAQITGLFFTAPSVLWVSTRSGLFQCDTDDRTCRRIALPESNDGNPDNDWVSPLILHKDHLWGTTAGHLVRLDPEKADVHLIALPKKQPTFFTYTGLSGAQDGLLWMTVDYKVFSYDPGNDRFQSYALKADENHLSTVEAWSILVDHEGGIWCGTRDQGLYRFDQDQLRFIHHIEDGLFVRSLHLVNEKLWVGGGTKGLYRLTADGNALEDFSNLHPMGHNGSWSNQILYDSSLQLIWIGTQKGLEKIDLIRPYFLTEQLPIPIGEGFPPYVLNVLQDQSANNEDTYWLKVIDRGLFRWSASEKQLTKIPGVAIGKANKYLVQDSRGRIWVNQYKVPTLQIYDAANNMTLAPPVPPDFTNVSCLHSDPNGNIWLGTFDNLVGKYDVKHDQFREIDFFRALQKNADQTDITTIITDPAGNTWITTDTDLYRIAPDGTSVEQIDLSGIVPAGTYLLSLLWAQAGRLWLGTRNGAFALDGSGKLLQAFRQDDPLPLSFVFQMTEDIHHRIWFGTSNGLFFTEGDSQLLQQFDANDGLLGNNNYFLSSDSQGRLFVGFPAAFNYLDTRQWPSQPARAPLVATELRVLDQVRKLDPQSGLTLQAGENFFTLQLGLLNYRQPHFTQYRYRLRGFEEHWHELDPEGRITYTNLDGGRYLLEAEAVYNRNPEQSFVLSLPIRAIPPFHRTIWFYLLLMILCIAVIAAFWYNRYRQNRHLQMMRHRIARDLHDDVGSTLSSIRFFSTFIRRQLAAGVPEAVAHLERIENSATEVTENMREIVWALQAHPGDLPELLARIREYGSRLMESRDIRFVAEIDPAFSRQKMDIHHQRNLYLICKESFNNAAKHAACTQVKWAIKRLPDGRNHLCIEDDGGGFRTDAVENGNGLPGLQKRADEMRGKLEVRTGPGQGVKIELIWR